MASRPKVLLQSIVRPWQILDLIALEEPVPIARRDCTEVGHGFSQRSQQVLLLDHGSEQALILPLEISHVTVFIVRQHMSRLMHPMRSLLNDRPELLCGQESALDLLL
jgi:hypothetical protein